MTIAQKLLEMRGYTVRAKGFDLRLNRAPTINEVESQLGECGDSTSMRQAAE